MFRNILDRLIYNDEYENIEEGLTDSNVGARKLRNIRDNIFVLSAVLNDVINGNAKSIDLQIYDVAKCFDALWLEEAVSDLYESGLTNDKLSLLFVENELCKVAVKTPAGLSRRVEIPRIVLQGTVFGNLECTSTMDKVGKNAYLTKNAIYSYKGSVEIPPLGMVDDELVISNCGNESVMSNAVMNTFIESKKLRFGESKCHKIHIGKPSVTCPELSVHGSKMERSKYEKYLGDLVSESGKIKENIAARRAKGFGISDGIMAILEEIPLGKHKLEMGLALRQAMLINGILYKSEAWQNISEDEYKQLEEVDNNLLRKIFKAHSKTSTSFLHLESGTLPIRFVVASRRLLYYFNILTRADSELVKRVLKAQMVKPTKGDWFNTIKEDFQLINEDIANFDEERLKSMQLKTYKKIYKEKD